MQTDVAYSGEKPVAAMPHVPPNSHPIIRKNRRLRLAFLPFGVFLVLWLILFYSSGAITRGPDGRALGSDFAMYWGATHVLEQDGNPFDPGQLYRTEQSLLQQEHLPIMQTPALVRVGNPPLFYGLMQPLAALPFKYAAILWMAAMYALVAAGFLALLRYFRWQARLVPLVAFLAMPQVALGVFYGNVIGLVFASLCYSLLLAREHPMWAGALATIACLKPQVALPAVLLIGLFTSLYRRRFFTGFAVALGILAALTVITTGVHGTALWLQALDRYSGDIAIQPNLSSLAGIYVREASSHIRLALETLTIAPATGLTIYIWFRARHRPSFPYAMFAILWLVWFLATPYAHFPDEILLTIPILISLGSNAGCACPPHGLLALYFAALSLLLFSWVPHNVQLLWLPLTVILAGQVIDTMRADVPAFVRSPRLISRGEG